MGKLIMEVHALGGFSIVLLPLEITEGKKG